MANFKKSIMKFSALIATAGTLVTSFAVPASAQLYSNGIRRGINYLCAVNTDVFWNVDSRNNITSSTAYQYASGLNCKEGGWYHIYQDPMEHIIDALAQGYVGFTAKGVGVGYNIITIKDRIHLANWNNLWVEWNVDI